VNVKYLAHNLKFYRHLADLAQHELASRAGGPPFSQAYISQIERGLRPVARHVDILARALGISRYRLLARPRVVRACVLARERQATGHPL
jgi:transcriptional regulator with XRE-family HTH domain